MPKKNTPHAKPLRDDKERQERFIALLREGTVGPVEAARRASPHLADSTNPRAGYSAFRDLYNGDPRFAERWESAIEEGREKLLAQLQETALKWIVEPTRKPVFQDGEVVGWVEDRNAAVKVLLRMLARLDPEWSERRQLEHSGGVQHDHRHLHAHVSTTRSLEIDPGDLNLLTEEKQDQLLALIAEMRERKEDEDVEVRRLPDAS